MAKINLLPWRERLREEQKRQFLFGLAGSAVLALVIMVLVHVTMSQRIANQQSRNTYLNQEIKLLDGKIREIKSLKKIKTALLARISIIEELQTKRMQVVHMFDELVKALPKGVHLTQIKRKNEQVVLIGKAESNSNVSKLMRNITASHWLFKPQLREIKTDRNDGKRISEFSMLLTLVNPHADKEIQ